MECWQKKFIKYADNKDVLIFASGVSNSLETSPVEFGREQFLLEKILAEHSQKKIIYFSTCSMIRMQFKQPILQMKNR